MRPSSRPTRRRRGAYWWPTWARPRAGCWCAGWRSRRWRSAPSSASCDSDWAPLGSRRGSGWSTFSCSDAGAPLGGCSRSAWGSADPATERGRRGAPGGERTGSGRRARPIDGRHAGAADPFERAVRQAHALPGIRDPRGRRATRFRIARRCSGAGRARAACRGHRGPAKFPDHARSPVDRPASDGVGILTGAATYLGVRWSLARLRGRRRGVMNVPRPGSP